MTENNTPAPIDDGRSPVAGTRGREMSWGTKFGLMGLVGVVALGFVWFNALYSHKAKTDVQPTTYAQGGEEYPSARFALSEDESHALADRAKSAGRFAHRFGDAGDGEDQAETDLDTPPWDEPEAEAA